VLPLSSGAILGSASLSARSGRCGSASGLSLILITRCKGNGTGKQKSKNDRDDFFHGFSPY
jgi:hypothetical protein